MAIITCKIPKELDAQLAAASPNLQLSAKPWKRNSRHGNLYDLMKEGLGCLDSGVADLATHKKHLEGYGRKKVRGAP